MNKQKHRELTMKEHLIVLFASFDISFLIVYSILGRLI